MVAVRVYLLRRVRSLLSPRYYHTSVMAEKVHKEHLSWTYDDQTAWGKVPGCEVANTGKRQSPINIQTADVKMNKDLTPLKLEGWDSLLHGMFQNTGHSLQFTPESSKPLLLTPHGKFSFKQFHFHWGTNSNHGSEHCVNGCPYAAEIHFVLSGSQDNDDSLAVLGILCQSDSVVGDNIYWKNIQVPQEPAQVIGVKDIKLRSYLPPDLDYYHYKGSLTTPPCSEKVLWYVIKQPLKVPEEFLVKVRQMKDVTGRMIAFNHRQCMPLHGRSVETPRSNRDCF